ncbi:MAG: hypothetical protein WC479_00555 [Candidatus Izemoplasmatales bacterium]
MSDEFAGNNEEDLLWKASIDDQTGKFFDNFNKNVEKTDKTVAAKSGGMSNSLLKVGAVVGVVGGVFGTLASMFVKAVTGGISGFGDLIKVAVQLRTETDALNRSLEITAGQAGYSSEQINKYVESLKDQSFTTRESLQTLKKMVDGELDLSRATELVTVAQDASIVSGMKVSDAMLQLIQVIAAQTEASAKQSNRQSAQMLKSLGLYVDFQAAYQKAALESGRIVEQLTAVERQQIALNAAIEAGTQITGAYESAQDSSSRIIKALPGYYEEVKYAIGAAFEPVYTAAIGDWEKFLKNLVEWLRDNEDEINQLGYDIAEFVEGSGKLLYELLLNLVDVIPKLITLIPDLSEAIAKELAPAFGMTAEQIENSDSAMTTLLKSLTLFKASVTATEKAFEILKSYGYTASEIEVAMLESATGVYSTRALSFMEEYQKAYADTFHELSITYGLVDEKTGEIIDKTKQLTEEEKKALETEKELARERETAVERQLVAAQKLQNALISANYKFTELKTSLEDEALERSIQKGRDDILAAISRARQIEDIERNNSERIQSILENAAEAKSELAIQAAEQSLQIEKDHQKRLQELLITFNYEAGELARKRDAVGLLSLVRQNKRQISEEERAVAERRTKAREEYLKTIQDMDESLQTQLRKAEEARQKEYESMNRNLRRQAELQNLYDKWAEEDRRRKLDRILRDMWNSFIAMDGMTQTGLNRLLQDWGVYFESLSALVNAYNSMLGISVPQSSSKTVIPVGTSQTSPGKYLTRNVGQAGQVSSELIDSGLINSLNSYNLKRIPSVAPSESQATRNMHITVDGTGLEPYVQRLVVNALIEVERNKG